MMRVMKKMAEKMVMPTYNRGGKFQRKTLFNNIMNTIIALLIIFFSILLVTAMFTNNARSSIVVVSANYEGMTSSTDASNNDEYQNYAPNDALILAQQNAGNIEYLKGRVANLDSNSTKVNQYIFDISNNLTTLNDQVNTIIDQQAQYAQSVASEPAPAMDLSMPSDSSSGTSNGGTSNGGTSSSGTSSSGTSNGS